MNNTLGQYYQGKPELLQAALNNMEETYNETAAELELEQARIVTLIARLEWLTECVECEYDTSILKEAAREARAALKDIAP